MRCSLKIRDEACLVYPNQYSTVNYQNWERSCFIDPQFVFWPSCTVQHVRRNDGGENWRLNESKSVGSGSESQLMEHLHEKTTMATPLLLGCFCCHWTSVRTPNEWSPWQESPTINETSTRWGLQWWASGSAGVGTKSLGQRLGLHMNLSLIITWDKESSVGTGCRSITK